MSKVLIGMPHIGGVEPKVSTCLFNLAKVVKGAELMFIDNSLIYDARNDLALATINKGFDELLFIDSDIVFPSDAYEKLKALDADIATGIYYGRRGKHNPIVYEEVKCMEAIMDKDGTTIIPAEAKHFETIPEGTFEVAGCGMGMCLIKVEVLKSLCKLWNNMPFEPYRGLGEDLAFCYRAKERGFKIKANAYIPLGHIGTKVFDEKDYIK